MTDAKEVGWGTLGETFRHRAKPLLQKRDDESKIFLRQAEIALPTQAQEPVRAHNLKPQTAGEP